MNGFERELNDTLVRIYRAMDKLEEKMLRASKTVPLTIAEVHALAAVAGAGRGGAATVGEISARLEIRPPTATAALSRLEQKGFVRREKSAADGRVVRVRLTRAGRRAESVHRFFHRNMVRAAVEGLAEEERLAMMKGIRKLDGFLQGSISEYTGIP